MKHDILDIKNDLLKPLDNLRFGISDKFENIIDKLMTIKSNFKENLKFNC